MKILYWNWNWNWNWKWYWDGYWYRDL